jgi:anti-sigma B factor antagonist
MRNILLTQEDLSVNLNIENIEGITVVSNLPNILDASNAIEFKTDISRVLDDNNQVVFDMCTLQFIDSAGCGALITSLRHVKNSGGALKLYNVQNQVRSVFELVRMHKIIDIFNTRQEALDSF